MKEPRKSFLHMSWRNNTGRRKTRTLLMNAAVRNMFLDQIKVVAVKGEKCGRTK